MWLMSNEDFNADEFLVDITKEWNDLPRVAWSANTFRNSPPPPLPRPITRVDTEILYRCPLHESEALQKKKTVTSTESGSITSVLLPSVSCPVVRIA